MLTASKIRCFVVVANAETDRMSASNEPGSIQPRFRPSDLLPWADPHIRSLVEQLQDEVREEANLRRDAATADPWAVADDSAFEIPTGPRF